MSMLLTISNMEHFIAMVEICLSMRASRLRRAGLQGFVALLHFGAWPGASAARSQTRSGRTQPHARRGRRYAWLRRAAGAGRLLPDDALAERHDGGGQAAVVDRDEDMDVGLGVLQQLHLDLVALALEHDLISLQLAQRRDQLVARL